MAKFSILIAICMVLTYTIVLRFLPFELEVPLHVQQSKFLIAENYLYGKNKQTDVVIVGSSMAERLNKKYFPKNIVNLSISGDRATTGIQLLKLSGKYPKVLLVEVNILTRTEDSTFINAFKYNFGEQLKYGFPFLQERNQFLTVVLNGLNYIHPIVKKKPKVSDLVLTSVQHKHQESINDTTMFRLIKSNVNELKVLLQELTNKGVKIYLFRMPIEKKTQAILDKSKRNQFERKLIKDQLLPISGLKIISDDLNHSYHTTDGVHLVEEDALYYAKYLQKALR